MAVINRDRVNPSTQDRSGDYVTALFSGVGPVLQAVHELAGLGISAQEIKLAVFDDDEWKRLGQLKDTGAEVTSGDKIDQALADEARQRRKAKQGDERDTTAEVSRDDADGVAAVPFVAAPLGTAGAWSGSSALATGAAVPGLVPVVTDDMNLFGGDSSRDLGLGGALIRLGISEEEARYFETAFAQGTILVVAHATGRVPEVRQRLQDLGGDVGSTRSASSATVRQVANRAQAGSTILDQ